MLGRAMAPTSKAEPGLDAVGLTATSEVPHGFMVAGQTDQKLSDRSEGLGDRGHRRSDTRHRRPLFSRTLATVPSHAARAGSIVRGTIVKVLEGRSRLLIGCLVLAMSVLWLGLIPWDLSEVDADGALKPGGGDDVFRSWRGVALAVGWFAATVGVAALAVPRRWTLLTVIVVGSFWFLWRTGSARVIGANLFLAGWLIAFLPALTFGGGLAVWFGGAVRSHFRPEL